MQWRTQFYGNFWKFWSDWKGVKVLKWMVVWNSGPSGLFKTSFNVYARFLRNFWNFKVIFANVISWRLELWGKSRFSAQLKSPLTALPCSYNSIFQKFSFCLFQTPVTMESSAVTGLFIAQAAKASSRTSAKRSPSAFAAPVSSTSDSSTSPGRAGIAWTGTNDISTPVCKSKCRARTACSWLVPLRQGGCCEMCWCQSVA